MSKLTPQIVIEEPYFDKTGKQIKEFAVLKFFHFKGRNEQGRGRKNYYMYKWVRLLEDRGTMYWVCRHLTDDSGSSFNMKAVAGPDRKVNAEIVQQYDAIDSKTLNG